MIDQFLWRNQGQVLTPELIHGLLYCYHNQPKPNNAIDVKQFEPMEYKGFTFQAELYEDVLNDLIPLHQMHYAEVDERLATLPCKPDYPEYVAINRAGRSIKFTIRKDGGLVGYCLVMVSNSLHTGLPLAMEDTFYMHPEHRGGFTMIRFTKWMVSCLQKIGIREIRVTSKLSNKAHLLMERAGFKPCAMQLVLMPEVTHENKTPI